jgi:hypothetical protein
MATVYKVEMTICSEFCSYPADELKTILETIIKEPIKEPIKDWWDKESGLGLLMYDLNVNKKI